MSIINNFNQKKNQDNYYVIQMEVFRRNDELIDDNSIDKNVKNHLFDFLRLIRTIFTLKINYLLKKHILCQLLV